MTSATTMDAPSGNSINDQQDDRRHRRMRRVLAFCAMLAVAMSFRAESLTDWDSWDYAAQAIMGHSSDLLLGRWWFLAIMRGSWLAGHWLGGLEPRQGYLVMQAVNALMMAGAVAAGMAWTYRITRNATAEMFFALLVVLGPMIGIYSSAVMTESGTLLMLALSLLAWEEAISTSRRAAVWALLAGLAFGVMVDMREQAGTLAAWFVVSAIADKPARRWRLLATGIVGVVITLGIGVAGGWAWYPWSDKSYFGNILQWTASMADERQRYPIDIADNLNWLGQFAVAATPLAALLFLPSLGWTLLSKPRRRLVWVFLGTCPYLLTLIINHDLSVNPRFILPAAWMLTPLVAAALYDAGVAAGGKWRQTRLALCTIALLAAGFVALTLGWDPVWRFYLSAAAGKQRAEAAMLKLPDRAMVVPGPDTGVAYYLNRLQIKHFDVFGSGWSWDPQQLRKQMAEAMGQGRDVYVNVDKEDWLRTTRKHTEWDELQQALQPYELEEGYWPMRQVKARQENIPATNPAILK